MLFYYNMSINKYSKRVINAKNISFAFKKLRRQLKEEGLVLDFQRKIIKIGPYWYRIYYKTYPRKVFNVQPMMKKDRVEFPAGVYK